MVSLDIVGLEGECVSLMFILYNYIILQEALGEMTAHELASVPVLSGVILHRKYMELAQGECKLSASFQRHQKTYQGYQ